MSTIIANGTLTSLTVDGVPWLPTGGSGPNFATMLQDAVNAGDFLDWPHGDVTLSAPLVIDCPNGSQGFGFDLHGARLICGFNNANADLIKFRVAQGTNDFAYAISVRNTFFDGAGSPGFNGSSSQCRNGLVFEAIGGNASMFGVRVTECIFNVFPNGSGCRFYGGIFESFIINCSSTNTGVGIELRQQDLGAGGQVISTIYVIGCDVRNSGMNTPSQGNDMGAMSSTSDQAFSGCHSVQFKNCTYVNNRGAGLWLSAGALQVDCCHFEANCRDAAGSRGAIFCFYGGVSIRDCDGANPDSGTTSSQNFLVEFSGNMDTSRDPSYIIGSYNELEGGGTFARLGHLAGTSTMYIDGWSRANNGLWTGAGTWTIRTQNYTNTTA